MNEQDNEEGQYLYNLLTSLQEIAEDTWDIDLRHERLWLETVTYDMLPVLARPMLEDNREAIENRDIEALFALAGNSERAQEIAAKIRANPHEETISLIQDAANAYFHRFVDG